MKQAKRWLGGALLVSVSAFATTVYAAKYGGSSPACWPTSTHLSNAARQCTLDGPGRQPTNVTYGPGCPAGQARSIAFDCAVPGPPPPPAVPNGGLPVVYSAPSSRFGSSWPSCQPRWIIDGSVANQCRVANAPPTNVVYERGSCADGAYSRVYFDCTPGGSANPAVLLPRPANAPPPAPATPVFTQYGQSGPNCYQPSTLTANAARQCAVAASGPTVADVSYADPCAGGSYRTIKFNCKK